MPTIEKVLPCLVKKQRKVLGLCIHFVIVRSHLRKKIVKMVQCFGCLLSSYLIFAAFAH